MKKHSIFFILFLTSILSYGQQYNIRGLVIDSVTLKPIPQVLLKVGSFSAFSDEEGRFEVLLSSGNYILSLLHDIYHPFERKISITEATEYTFALVPKGHVMSEVEVRGGGINQRAAPAAQTLTRNDLEKAPAFLGQHDPIKTIETLPGTGNSGDGNSGLYIRGGTSGQNLTLFNDAIVYNPSHLLGFFSVFNSTSVQRVNLYRSGIPSEFGGRLSSIIEISSSKRIQDSLSSEVNISPFSLNGNINIPITKNWSISTSVRKTLMNYTVWPTLTRLGFKSSAFEKLQYDFYDLNLNSNTRIGDYNFIYISAYNGGDDFAFSQNRFGIKNGMDWNNTATSALWRSILNPNLTLNTSVSFSRYNFNFSLNQDAFAARINSKIRDLNFKSILNIFQESHNIKAGVEYTDHVIHPNTPYAKSDTLVYDFGAANMYRVDESSIFASGEFNISSKLDGYVGFRTTYYRQKGPYSYTNDDLIEKTYSAGSTVKSFLYFEPSVTLKYRSGHQSAVKLSYSKNTQPLHQISVTAVNFPADFWMPSIKGLNPQKGHQVSLGYFYDGNASLEAYVDLYFKKMDGLVEFSGGLMNMLNNLKIEENLNFGRGNSYGSEFFIKKRAGTLSGWAGYTISKSERSFDLINQGKTFPAKYDRRHDLNTVLNYVVSSRLSFGSLFTYSSGNTYTKPVGRYFLAGNVVNEYGAFNGSRMPDYHRVDLSATYKLQKRKHSSSEISVSVYNVYNRKNPIYLYFMAEGNLDTQRISIQPKSVAILPVLPSINYLIKFF